MTTDQWHLKMPISHPNILKLIVQKSDMQDFYFAQAHRYPERTQGQQGDKSFLQPAVTGPHDHIVIIN